MDKKNAGVKIVISTVRSQYFDLLSLAPSNWAVGIKVLQKNLASTLSPSTKATQRIKEFMAPLE